MSERVDLAVWTGKFCWKCKSKVWRLVVGRVAYKVCRCQEDK